MFSKYWKLIIIACAAIEIMGLLGLVTPVGQWILVAAVASGIVLHEEKINHMK